MGAIRDGGLQCLEIPWDPGVRRDALLYMGPEQVRSWMRYYF